MSRKKERNLNLLKIRFESIENSLFIYFILFLFDFKNFFYITCFIRKFYLKIELRIKKKD